MSHSDAACQTTIARCMAGEISAETAVMEMLIEAEDLDVIEHALEVAASREDPYEPHSKSLASMRRLVRENRDRCAELAQQLRAEQMPTASKSVEESLRAVRELFDRLVAHSEEASVALYSLGNPEILAQATAEVVAWLEGYQLLKPGARVLDFGCGIGRIAAAIGPRVARVEAVDISSAMVDVAAERCAPLVNVRVQACNGRDLRGFESATLDLVLAVDSFPYVVQAGRALVETTMAEVARVLVTGGHLVLFNYAYDKPLGYQRAKVTELASRHGFHVEVGGVQPFTLWNGAVFLLRRDATRGVAGRRSPYPPPP